MAYNENINLFVTTDRNNADVLNAPLEKIIQNIQDTREYLNQLQVELDQLELRLQSEYTNTEQLNDILANGIKGDKGDPGEGLAYNWNGTALGVKLVSESEFIYTDLKGDPGDVSTEQLEEALTDYPTLEYLEEALQDYVTNSSLTTTLQDYVTNSSLTTTLNNNYLTSAQTTLLMNSFMDDVAMTYATQSSVNEIEMDLGDNVKPAIATNTANIATNTTNIANLTTKVNGNLIKTGKNNVQITSASAFGANLTSCVIGNNTVGSVWTITGTITYNISTAPTAGSNILNTNQTMVQYADCTIYCPCMTATNAYITLTVKNGSFYYTSYTGSAPTSGSRYFVSAVIPLTVSAFVS